MTGALRLLRTSAGGFGRRVDLAFDLLRSLVAAHRDGDLARFLRRLDDVFHAKLEQALVVRRVDVVGSHAVRQCELAAERSVAQFADKSVAPLLGPLVASFTR